MPPFFSAGETTEGENGNLKIIWGNFDILEVAMARSVGYANQVSFYVLNSFYNVQKRVFCLKKTIFGPKEDINSSKYLSSVDQQSGLAYPTERRITTLIISKSPYRILKAPAVPYFYQRNTTTERLHFLLTMIEFLG